MQQASAGPSNPPDERRALIDTTREWGYFFASPALVELFRGKRVLDVGMGAGPHAGFCPSVESGAAAYIGVDPIAGSQQVSDLRSLKEPSVPSSHAFPFSTRDIERLYPNVRIYRAVLEDVAREVKAARPNFAIMNSVTEHLEHPDSVMHAIWEVRDPDAMLWVNHHGYHSWSGHHALPRDVGLWDPSKPAHNAMVDWKHLDPEHPCYGKTNLNRICPRIYGSSLRSTSSCSAGSPLLMIERS